MVSVLIALALFAAAESGSQVVAKADPPKVDAPERVSDSQDKMICKRFIETGSLVRGYRTCKTKREWERERDNIRASGPGVDSCSARANGGAC